MPVNESCGDSAPMAPPANIHEPICVASVTLACMSVLFLIHWLTSRSSPNKAWREFEIVAFAHATVTACGSCYVFYSIGGPVLYVNHLLSGEEALTTLERVLPMATWGYSLWDIGHGVAIRDNSLIYHGCTLFIICSALCHFQKLHMITMPLIMELSTVFLNLIRFDNIVLQLTFCVLFLVTRWLLAPYMWAKYVQGAFFPTTSPRLELGSRPEDVVVLVGGMAFHILNGYWGVKIIQKALRKLGRRYEAVNDEKKSM